MDPPGSSLTSMNDFRWHYTERESTLQPFSPRRSAAPFLSFRALLHTLYFVLWAAPSIADLKLTCMWLSALSHSRPEKQPKDSSIIPSLNEKYRRLCYCRSNPGPPSSVWNHRETKREMEMAALSPFSQDGPWSPQLFFKPLSVPW